MKNKIKACWGGGGEGEPTGEPLTHPPSFPSETRLQTVSQVSKHLGLSSVLSQHFLDLSRPANPPLPRRSHIFLDVTRLPITISCKLYFTANAPLRL